MPEMRDRPLARWGETLRREMAHRRRLQRRLLWGLIALSPLALTIAWPPSPRLVWNVSASAPRGLYLVAAGAPLAPGDMVIARLPREPRELAARRHYLPANVPLVKRVAAAPGDLVCAIRDGIFVNGRLLARRRPADGLGRLMPAWQGCLRLRLGSYLLLMADQPDSFDGRYFGVTTRDNIIGRAALIWAR